MRSLREPDTDRGQERQAVLQEELYEERGAAQTSPPKAGGHTEGAGEGEKGGERVQEEEPGGGTLHKMRLGQHGTGKPNVSRMQHPRNVRAIQ